MSKGKNGKCAGAAALAILLSLLVYMLLLTLFSCLTVRGFLSETKLLPPLCVAAASGTFAGTRLLMRRSRLEGLSAALLVTGGFLLVSALLGFLLFDGFSAAGGRWAAAASALSAAVLGGLLRRRSEGKQGRRSGRRTGRRKSGS